MRVGDLDFLTAHGVDVELSDFLYASNSLPGSPRLVLRERASLGDYSSCLANNKAQSVVAKAAF